MAASLSHSHFQTRKSFSLLLSISVTFFLLLLSKVNSTTETVSFTFNKFEPRQPNVILQRDALITSTGKLQLTKVEGGKPIYHSLGRALYSAPIRIWDNNTGNVASFVTAFSFVITAPPNSSTAEGLAFFLAPVNTQPQGYGGTLGLFPGPIPSSSYETVAVEFDTNFNAWDPKGRHIGIDVNSITSIKTTPWALAIGEVANVVISYQASTKSLTASLVYPSLETSFILNAVVDFKAVLPEWVRVGFSATSGNLPNYIETHDVLSWSFESRLSDSSNDALENVTEAHLSSFVLPA